MKVTVHRMSRIKQKWWHLVVLTDAPFSDTLDYHYVLLLYYHSWKFDWRFMWIFHYLSIFIQISVIVPPEGMVIMKMPIQMFVLCPIYKFVFILLVCSYFPKFFRKWKKNMLVFSSYWLTCLYHINTCCDFL